MSNWIYILIMALVSFLIRVTPIIILKAQIKSTFIRSFLYYVPYVTLAVMTFPAMIHATQHIAAGIVALVAGAVSSWFGLSMYKVAIVCCVTVFIMELFLI